MWCQQGKFKLRTIMQFLMFPKSFQTWSQSSLISQSVRLVWSNYLISISGFFWMHILSNYQFPARQDRMSCPAGHRWAFSDFRLKWCFHIRLVWDVIGGCLRARYELFGSCTVSYWSKNQVWHWILILLLFSVCCCHSGLRCLGFFWKNRCRIEPQLWTNSDADCHNEIIDDLLFPFLMLNSI